jgi:recombination protein RecA
MREQQRQHAIWSKLARMESVRRLEPLSTGLARLDAALGAGGLPRGRIVELFGPGCGKTTLALQTVAHIQAGGSVAGWLDADRTFDPAYASGLGVAVEKMPVVQPESAEQALEIAYQLSISGALDLLVIDSAAALVPRLELEAAIGESGPGLQARVLASGLRKLSTAAARSGMAVLVLNQVRSSPQAGGGDAETSAGGPALKLYSAVRIALGPAPVGRVRFRIVKSKVAAAFVEGELEWDKGGGFAKTP